MAVPIPKTMHVRVVKGEPAIEIRMRAESIFAEVLHYAPDYVEEYIQDILIKS
jgi:hypothetical protein